MVGRHVNKNADGVVPGGVVIESPSPEGRFQMLHNCEEDLSSSRSVDVGDLLEMGKMVERYGR